MKKLLPLIALYCIAFLVLACAPQSAPTPISPAPTGGPTTVPPPLTPAPTSAPSQGNVPTPQVNLPTPPAQPSSVFGGSVVNAKLGEEFILHIKDTAMLTDSSNQFGITLYNVTQDSRCPQGVACVWAGEVRLQITFRTNGVEHPPVIEMTTNPGAPEQKRQVDDYIVEVLKAAPPANGPSTPIPPQDYAITFRVTAAPTTQATPPPPPDATIPAQLDQPVTLKYLQTLALPQDALRATFNGVFEESRCPASVNCAVAGRALVSFQVMSGGKLGNFVLSTQPPDGRTNGFFQGYVVELLKVEPYPQTPDQKTPDQQYSVTVVVHQMPPPTTATKNQGFPLHIGQSIPLAGEDATVKLVSVTEDSRCPYPAQCFVRGNAMVTVTLTEANGNVTMFVLNDDPSKQNTKTPETSLYSVELLALNPYPQMGPPAEPIKPEEYEATLVVHKFATPQSIPTKTPVAQAPTVCAGLTAGDAESILGAPVQPAPVENVLINVLAPDNTLAEPKGLCGYLSVAKLNSDVRVMTEPYEIGHEAAAAFTADRLRGPRILELLRIVGILKAANPEADDTAALILQTRLAAGDWDNLFDSFKQLQQGREKLHFESVDSFGDEGLWAWRPGAAHNYAALLVREDSEFVVAEALLPTTISEAAAKESIESAMEKAFP